MQRHLRTHSFLVLLLAAAWLAGCATAPYPPVKKTETAEPRPNAVLDALALDHGLEERILALDPEHISEHDVRTTLAAGPTPQIVLIHGGIYPVHLAMTSFAKFLIAMGYPEEKVRHPGDRRYSHSPYENSAQIAGLIAWYYERDGVRPLMIGHSQGGMQAVKVLHELAGAFADRIPVWDPYTDAAEDRTTIIDPLTGKERPVVGSSLAYASAVGAGGAAFLLPNQWSMLHRLRTIPNTVDDFTGFTIGVDLVAWSLGDSGANRYRHNGTAHVRNVLLPAQYNHVTVPVTAYLASDAKLRDWINGFNPEDPSATVSPPEGTANILWAAHVWHSIKKHWCLEAQRLIRAKRAAMAKP